MPLRQDSNYLYVERPATGAEIAAELGHLQLPMATLPDEGLFSGDLAGLELAHRGVVMVHRGGAAAPPRPAVEVGHRELEPLRRASILAEPWGSEAVADQLLAAKPLVAERLTARFFAAYEDGEPVAYADLYLAGTEAQIEDVGTAPARRGRGHGTAVVLTALAEAHAAGADFVFLVADEDDWPHQWYARLGFETVGRYVKLRLGEAP